jgi:hypothetical protein
MRTKTASHAAFAVRINKFIEHVKTHLNDFDIPPPPDFSEENYLKRHPDVADLVLRGELKSGYHHWILYGRAEGRSRSS